MCEYWLKNSYEICLADYATLWYRAYRYTIVRPYTNKETVYHRHETALRTTFVDKNIFFENKSFLSSTVSMVYVQIKS